MGRPWVDFFVKPMGWDGLILKKRPWVGWAKARQTHGLTLVAQPSPAQLIRTSDGNLLWCPTRLEFTLCP